MATWRNYVCRRISIRLDMRCIFARVGIGVDARAVLFSRLTSLFGSPPAKSPVRFTSRSYAVTDNTAFALRLKCRWNFRRNDLL
jgi:hypothetical protein